MNSHVLPSSQLLVVIPLSDTPTGEDQKAPFREIDPDVNLPSSFFAGLRRRTLDVPPSVLSNGDHHVTVNGAQAIGVGEGDLEGWFLVVDVAPRSGGLEEWLRIARALSKSEWAEVICRHIGSERASSDTRGTVLASLMLTETADVKQVADHLATRAPFGEQLVRLSDTGATPLSELQYQVVTRRTCGFVTGNTGDSKFFKHKFADEIRNQYLLAVVLADWQAIQLGEILNLAHGIWGDSLVARGVLTRAARLRDRFERLNQLRVRHAQLVGSGSFGPAFDSGSQSRFWRELEAATGMRQRYDEVNDALSTLAQSTETEASLNLENLLAFFTLVIGVPSLAFTVLGVNITRLTSDTGLSVVLVTAVLLMCLVVGAAAYFLFSGLRRSAGARRGRSDKSPQVR